MGHNNLRNIALTVLGSLLAGGCAGSSAQSSIKFPGYHTSGGITPAVVERVAVEREELAAEVSAYDPAEMRYRNQYRPADYSLMSHLYGPYQHLSWRERHWLEYQRRLAFMGYGTYYDPFYGSFGWQGGYGGYAYYDPWGWGSNYYGYYDPFYYSSRYNYGYGYSYGGYRYGSNYNRYRSYSPIFGGTSSKGATISQRRTSRRKGGSSGTFGSRFSGNTSYAGTTTSSGKTVSRSRGTSRSGGSSVKSSGGKSSSSGTKATKSSSKSSSRKSKRKD